MKSKLIQELGVANLKPDKQEKKAQENLYWFKSSDPTSSLNNSTLKLLVSLTFTKLYKE